MVFGVPYSEWLLYFGSCAASSGLRIRGTLVVGVPWGLIRLLSCQMAAWEWRMLTVYFESVYIFTILSLASARTCISVTNFAFSELVPGGSGLACITLEPPTKANPALFWESVLVKLPSMNHVSEIVARGELLMWGKGIGVTCKISMQLWWEVSSEVGSKVARLRDCCRDSDCGVLYVY